MNTTLLKEIVKKIKNLDIPEDHVLFGGTNLIITNVQDANSYPHNNHHNYPEDIIVVSDFACQISWLIFQLGHHVYKVNAANKYSFYPVIGEKANEMIKKNSSLNEILLAMVEWSIEWHKENH